MPSASGSENGTPSSRISAPAFSRASARSTVRARLGSPAQMYGIKPLPPSVRKRAKQLSIRFCITALELCVANVQSRTFNLQMPEHEKTLTINEIYHSIQGESTWAGRPCVFVRLTFCDLRCSYCDTEYAFYEGRKETLKEIVDAVAAFQCPLVEITGGEPLLQKNVLPLMTMLADTGLTLLLETSGAHDISVVDAR